MWTNKIFVYSPELGPNKKDGGDNCTGFKTTRYAES